MSNSQTEYFQAPLLRKDAEMLDEPAGSNNVCWINQSDSESDSVCESIQKKPRVGLRGGGGRQYTLAEKLEARTVRGPSCWEVQGYANPHNGYTQIASHGPQHPDRVVVYAHRLAWRIANGDAEIPAGSVVMHACDNPRCVNPAHLSLGTQQDNIRDAVRKGRWAVRKLTDEDVATIRELRASGVQAKAIAARFGIGRSTVSDIARGVSRTERIGEPAPPRNGFA